jgi:hypothetical protein
MTVLAWLGVSIRIPRLASVLTRPPRFSFASSSSAACAWSRGSRGARCDYGNKPQACYNILEWYLFDDIDSNIFTQ